MRQPSTRCAISLSPHWLPSSSSSSVSSSSLALLAANLFFFAVSPVDANPAVWPSSSTSFHPAPSDSPHKRTCLDGDDILNENRIKASLTASPIPSPLPTRVVHRRNTVVDRYSQGIDGKWRIPTTSITLYGKTLCPSCNTEDAMPTTTKTATYSLSSDIPYPSNGTLDEKYQAIRDKLPPGWTKSPANTTYDHSPTVLGLSLACAFMIICIIACAAYWRKRDRAQSRAKKNTDPEKTSHKRGGKRVSSDASIVTYSLSSSASIISHAEVKQKKWARALAKWKSKVKASAKTRRERRAFAKSGAAMPSRGPGSDVVRGSEDDLDGDGSDDEGPEEPIVASASAVSSSPRSSLDSQRSRRSSSTRRSRSPSVLTAAPTASLRPSVSRTAITAAAAATSAVEIHAGSSSAPVFEATASPPAYPRSPSPLEKQLSYTYPRSSQDDEGSNGTSNHHFLQPPPPPATSIFPSSSSSSSLSPSHISHRSPSVHCILPPPSPPPPLPYLTYSGHVATDDKHALGRMAEFASAPPAEAPISGTSTAPHWLNEEEQLAEIRRLEMEEEEEEEEAGRRRSINGRRISIATVEFSTAGPSSSAPASTSLSAAAPMGSSLPPPPPASSSKGRSWAYDYAFDYAEGDVPVEVPSAPPFASHDDVEWELHASAPPALDGMGEGEEESLRALASAPPLLEDDEDDEEYANGLVGAGASSSSDDYHQGASSTGSVDGQDHDRHHHHHHHRHLSSASMHPGQRMSLTPLPLYRP